MFFKWFFSEFEKSASRFIVLLLVIYVAGVHGGIGRLISAKKHFTSHESVDISCEYNNVLKASDFLTLHLNSSYNGISLKNQTITIDYKDSRYDRANKSFTVHMDKLDIGRYDIMCAIRRENDSTNIGIDAMDLYVGTKPQPIKNFNCINYAFDKLNCSFDAPYNPVETAYSVEVHIGNQNIQPCPLLKSQLPSSRYECSIENLIETGTPYKFYVTSKNSLSDPQDPLIESFDVDILNVTVPAKVELKLVETTISSAKFHFNLDETARYEHKTTQQPHNGLLFNLTLQSHVGFLRANEDFQYTIPNDGDKFTLTIKNLPYPSYKYNVTLRSKMRLSPNNSDMYLSEPSHFTFKTKPTLPYRPPITERGAFEFIKNRAQIKIFWKSLEDYEYNGENFRYEIKVYKNGSPTILKVIETSSFSRTYEIRETADYKFEIFSMNEVGTSEDSSIVYVSKDALNREKLIEDVWRVTNETSTSLTWSNTTDVDFENFTIFWCPISYVDEYSSCNRSINFIHVPKEERSHVFQTTQNFNYFISMNFLDYSSGIVWNSCSARYAYPDRDLQTVRNFRVNRPAQKRRVELSWSTDCKFKSIIDGYNLKYCMLGEGDKCLNEDEEEVKVLGNKLENFTVSELKPYTRYIFSINMFRGNVSSPFVSEIVETSQDAPSPPRNLMSSNVTSSTVFLNWTQPEEMNGVFKKYIIYFNDKSAETNNTNITLTNLGGDTEYTLYVVATTVENSDPSNETTIKTLIGVPSNPEKKGFSYENGMGKVSWEKPKNPNGRIDYYEVHIGDQMSLVKSLSCTFKCDKNQGSDMKIIAVNAHIDSSEGSGFEDDEEDYSLCEEYDASANIKKSFQRGVSFYKSEPLIEQLPCSTNYSMPSLIMIVLGSLFVPGFLILTACKIHKMNDIKALVPSGLVVDSSSPIKHNIADISHDDVESDQTMETTDNECSTLTGREYNNYHNRDFEEVITDKPKQQSFVINNVPVNDTFTNKEVPGYIKIQKSSEYIQPSAFGGYVPISEFTKPKKESEYYPIETEESSMPAPLMSGYVTPGGNFYK